MKISMKTLASGPTGVLRPGVVYDLPEEEAKQLIEGRYAAAVEDSTPAPGPDAAKVVVPVEESKIEKDGSEDDEPSKDEDEPRSPAGKAGDAAFKAAIESGASEADATLAAMKAAAAVPGSEYVAPKEPDPAPVTPASDPVPETPANP